MARKDILTRLADAGEDAIARLTDAPGAERMLGAVTSMRDRMDELQKRVRGIDELEKRVAALERRLDAQKARSATSARSSAGRTTKAATRKAPTTAAKKPAASAKTAKAKAPRSTAKSSTRRTGSGSPG